MLDLDNWDESMCETYKGTETDEKVMEEFMSGLNLAHRLITEADEFYDESGEGRTVEQSAENYRNAEKKLTYAYDNSNSWMIKNDSALMLSYLCNSRFIKGRDKKTSLWKKLHDDTYLMASITEALSKIEDSASLIRSVVLETAAKKGPEMETAIKKKLDGDDDEDICFDSEPSGGYGTADDSARIKNVFIEKVLELIKEFTPMGVAADSRLHDALWALGYSGRKEVEGKLWAMSKRTEFNYLQQYGFCFSDITRLSARDLQKVLREINQQDLAKALKIESDKVREEIFVNMSRRAATMLREDIRYMGPIRRKDVYIAQDRIVEIIQKMAESGEIILETDNPDDFIN